MWSSNINDRIVHSEAVEYLVNICSAMKTDIIKVHYISLYIFH